MAKIDYEIEQLNETDYKLKMSYEFNNNLFMTGFSKSLKKLRHESIKDSVIPNGFEVPDSLKSKYFPMLAKIIASDVFKIRKECKSDNFEIVSFDISDVRYIKKTDDLWDCIISIKGCFVKK